MDKLLNFVKKVEMDIKFKGKNFSYWNECYFCFYYNMSIIDCFIGTGEGHVLSKENEKVLFKKKYTNFDFSLVFYMFVNSWI